MFNFIDLYSNIPSWALIITVILIGIHIYLRKVYSYFDKKGIYYRKPLPFVGNSGPILFRKLSFPDYVINVYNEFKSHSVGGVYEFMNPIYVITDLDLIKQITIKDFDNFPDRRVFKVNEDVDPLLGKMLVTLTGRKWKVMRTTLSPTFTTSKIKAMFVLAEKCGKQLNNHIYDLIKEHNKNQSENIKGEEPLQVDMRDLFTRFTNDVIATSAFGVQCNSFSEPNNEFYTVGTRVSKPSAIQMIKMFLLLFLPKLMRILRVSFFPPLITNFFRKLIKETIDAREKSDIIRPDMIHLLMQARKGELKVKDEETNEADSFEDHKAHQNLTLTDDDIAAQVLIFFFAGFDTTANSLCIMSHQIAVHPEIQEKLHAEIDSIIGDKEVITYDDIQQMKYLDMVLSETLRKYSIAPITDRKSNQTYFVKGNDKYPSFTIEKGSSIWIPISGIHHDPEYYPDPEKFDPERFNDENKHKIQPMTYLPFGVGPRNCIGSRFALMEVKLAIATIMSEFTLVKVPKTHPDNIQFTKKNFAVTVDGGWWLGFEPRNKSTSLHNIKQ